MQNNETPKGLRQDTGKAIDEIVEVLARNCISILMVDGVFECAKSLVEEISFIDEATLNLKHPKRDSLQSP